jgi:hypothetical protein
MRSWFDQRKAPAFKAQARQESTIGTRGVNRQELANRDVLPVNSEGARQPEIENRY